MSDFSKEHVFITGGGTGIGLAIAKAFSKGRAKITLAARNLERVKEATAKLKTTQGVKVDVTDPASIERAIKKAAKTFGPVTILINNAGAEASQPFSRTDRKIWDHMLGVNLTGVYNMTRAVFPEMKKAGAGKIINIASIAGLEGFPYTSAYCAAKHGVIGLTRALASEFKEGLTINAVCPGFTRTDMVERAITNIMDKTGLDRETAEAEIIKLNPGGRMIEPEEVAGVVVDLARGGKNGEIIALTGEGRRK